LGGDEVITKKQKEVLKVINSFITDNDYSPSVRELAILVNIKSTATMHGYLNRLEKQGYIIRRAFMPRTLRVMKKLEE